MNIEDMVGKTFGFWTVKAVERFNYADQVGRKRLVVECKCGKIGHVAKGDLERGRTTRCRSCSFVEVYRKPNGEAAFNKHYGAYRANAKKKDILFEITREDFEILVTQDCFYCDSSPSMKLVSAWDEVYANGLDKKVPTDGYVMSNIVTACWTCNRMKSDMSVEDFLSHISKIQTLTRR